MWKEILVDDIEGLEKCSEMVNYGSCGTAFICSVSWLQQKLRWLTEATCYYYEDTEMKACAFNSYDAEIDRVINKFFYLKLLKVPTNPDKRYEIGADNCKVVLERYSKIIRVRKWAEYDIIKETGKTQQENTDKQIEIYERIGIKVSDFKKYTEFELI